MTRINLIPPQDLCDKHLIAEYRELPRIAKIAKRKYETHPNFIPPETYRMGPGHVLFFVNKGQWLSSRFTELVIEMNERNFFTSYVFYPTIVHPVEWFNDWVPSKEEIQISKNRINERLKKMKKNK